jgi:hypothetical protein
LSISEHADLTIVTAQRVTEEMFLTVVYLFPNAIASQGR